MARLQPHLPAWPDLDACLHAVEPRVRDAVLAGPALYLDDVVPELDCDLVVTVDAASVGLDPGDLRDRFGDVAEAAAGRSLNVIVRRPGEDLGRMALEVLAGRTVAGAGETVHEARGFYELHGGAAGALAAMRVCLRLAEDLARRAAAEPDADYRFELYRTAFDKLFDAGFTAALLRLARGPGGWGRVGRSLPPPEGDAFREMVTTLHVTYGRRGRFPDGGEAALFQSWLERVRTFAAGVESHAAAGPGDAPIQA